jgi:hypothetical protein
MGEGVGVGISHEFGGGQRSLSQRRVLRLDIDLRWGQGQGGWLRLSLEGPTFSVRICAVIEGNWG